MPLQIPSHEQFSEVRQVINESPAAQEHSCFHIEYNGKRINEFGLVSEIPDLTPQAEIRVIQDPYTEKEARLHVIRIRDLIGAAASRPDAVQGVLPGLSIYDSVHADATAAAAEAVPAEYDFAAPIDPNIILPRLSADEVNAPKTVKAIQISPWNPPPANLRQKGHLLYLIITTNEGEQVQITAHVSGFFVNKSSNAKFDPLPRPAPKNQSAHSLLSLIRQLSPSFDDSFVKLQEFNSKRDPLSTYQINNSLPAAPWLVPSQSSPSCVHTADITRTQEAYLISGTDSVDSLRDWNEELQSARELPRETVQDRIFRERLVSKVFADYIDAATRGALLVASGEINPLNPTEGRDAQIFVFNNIFFSFGADGVGTFTSEGGDEAARVATGKDVAGVRHVNQLDIENLYSPGTVVVDYLGKRIVGQSLVPGIFKQREPGENQIDYGAVDGKEVVAADERFAEPFAKLSQSLNVKPHTVWDGKGKAFKLEASVETKGLMGTDGRKYVLDLYRITPLDIQWQEENDEAEKAGESAYPHRMTVLRPELIEAYSRFKLREWLDSELAKRTKAKEEAEAAKTAKAAKKAAKAAKAAKAVKAAKKESSDSDDSDDSEESSDSDESEESDEDEDDDEKKEEKPEVDDRIDVSKFKFSLNPDAFSGQVPQTDEEKEQMTADEKDVRAVGDHLRATVIPGLVRELSESEINFPMDGRSLTQLLHKAGINVRYLGRIAKACEGEKRLVCLQTIAVREMISRAFKHVSAKYLRYLPLPLTSACIAHLLNCLFGASVNANPESDVDPALRELYSDADLAFEKVTPESLREDIEAETVCRFRFTLPTDWHSAMTGHLQLLREVSLKLGIQVLSKKFAFTAEQVSTVAAPTTEAAQNGKTNGTTNGASKKKNKKAGQNGSPAVDSQRAASRAPHTFAAEDIVNVVPIVKNSAPRSILSEEAMEAGRISLQQNQIKIGQELLLESLSLH